MFWALALAMVLLVLLGLLWPLRAGRVRQMNLAGTQHAFLDVQQGVFSAQWRELEHEYRQGLLTAEHYHQACTELQRRLLAEAVPTAQAGPQAGQSAETRFHSWARPATLGLIVLGVPMSALTGYYFWGQPNGLSIASSVEQSTAQSTPIGAAEIAGMVERLAQRVQKTPDDVEAWAMLARSYKVMGQYADAANAYAELLKRSERSPALLAEYAQMLAMSGEGFKGKAGQLVAEALKQAPDDPQILLLAGAAAREAQQWPLAMRYWERALSKLDPESEAAQALRDLLAQMRRAETKKE